MPQRTKVPYKASIEALTINEMKRQQLINGETFSFQTRDEEDLRIAELSHFEMTGKFIIWFNGQLIFSGTFEGMKKRFSKLSEKWDLIPASEENIGQAW